MSEKDTHGDDHGQSGLEELLGASEQRRKPGLISRLRTYFLAGVVVAAPIGITIWLTWWFVSLFDLWIKPLVPARYNPDTYLPIHVPGFGLVVAFIAITAIGALAANLFGRTIISYWEHLLDRMPVVRNVYKALKQIFQTALSQSHSSFRQVGIIEYPRKGLYALVFVSRDVQGDLVDKANSGELVGVFLPTTPNPTSGFLLFVPKADVILLDMSVEDAAKLIISAGLVQPDHRRAEAPAPEQVPVLTEEQARRLADRSKAKDAAE